MGDADSAARQIRPEHERLVRELAELPESERRIVVAAAYETTTHRVPAISTTSLRAAYGAVSLGGNAVEDCERLYDDT